MNLDEMERRAEALNVALSVRNQDVLTLIAALREALTFYGDPGIYHSFNFYPDADCGDFIKDFEEIEGEEIPGKRARQALAKTEAGR